MSDSAPAGAQAATGSQGIPANGPIILVSLILVAAVANLNLSVANVALPSIGLAFDASQTQLDLVAVGYSLGLAASVLWLGAVGDHYGRKMMLLLGIGLSIPACLLAAFAPSIEVLIGARIVGGVSAGMAFPTTLALITALWAPGPGRTRSIALWSALGGAIAALGPLVSGFLLERFEWGSVFLVTLPLAAVALFMAWRFVPAHVNETDDPVDNLGGILSAVLVGTLILAINFAPVPSMDALVIGLVIVCVAATMAFVVRQRRTKDPLYDLDIAARPTFWVAALAGIIVFGSLMGAMFIGQQYLQNVLQYSTFEAGAAIVPAALLMVLVAPRSAVIVEAQGARFTLLIGYVFVLGFSHAAAVAGGQPLLGRRPRVWARGHRGRPRRHPRVALADWVRARDASRMASGTADLQRDLGGAIMQSIFGALLTAGYAAAAAAAAGRGATNPDVTTTVQNQLTMSYAGAADVAAQYPQYSTQIIQGAKEAFLAGDQWAYLAGIIAVLIGAVLVFLKFPRKDRGASAARPVPRAGRSLAIATRRHPAGTSWITDGVSAGRLAVQDRHQEPDGGCRAGERTAALVSKRHE